MTLLSLITTTSRYALERIERTYTRQQLLKLDDYVLTDLGINRELLEQGISHFPWKSTETETLGYESMIGKNEVNQPSVPAVRKTLERQLAQSGNPTLNPSYV